MLFEIKIDPKLFDSVKRRFRPTIALVIILVMIILSSLIVSSIERINQNLPPGYQWPVIAVFAIIFSLLVFFLVYEKPKTKIGFVNFDDPPTFSCPLRHKTPPIELKHFQDSNDLIDQLKLYDVLVLNLDRFGRDDKYLDDSCIYWINLFSECYPSMPLVGTSEKFTFRMLGKKPIYICKSLDELERYLRHNWHDLFER